MDVVNVERVDDVEIERPVDAEGVAEGFPGEGHVVPSRDLLELGVRELHLGLGDVEPRRHTDVESSLRQVQVLLVVAHVLVGHDEQAPGLQQVVVALLDCEEDGLASRADICIQGMLGRLGRMDRVEALAEVEENLGEGESSRIEVEGLRPAADRRPGARSGAGVAPLRAVARVDLGKGSGNRFPRLRVTDVCGGSRRLDVRVPFDCDLQTLGERLLGFGLRDGSGREQREQQPAAR